MRIRYHKIAILIFSLVLLNVKAGIRNSFDPFGRMPSSYALYLDGINDYIDLGNDPSHQLQSFAAVVWVKTSSQNVSFMFSHSDVENALYSWGLRYETLNKTLYFGHDYVAEIITYETSGLNDGIWHQIGIYRTDANMTGIILDGSVVAESLSPYEEFFNFGDLLVGKRSDGYGIANMTVSDMRIYNKTLSTEEISNLYDGIDVSDGLVAWWPMSEGHGNIVSDMIGTGYGTLLPDFPTDAPVWVTAPKIKDRR